MKTGICILIFSLVTTSIQCNRTESDDIDEDIPAESPAVLAADSIIFYTTSLYSSVDSCQINDAYCTYIRMHYPVIEDGPVPAVDTIRKRVEELLQVSNHKQIDPQAIADSFIAGYVQYRDKFSAPGQQLPPWYMKKNINVTYSSKRFFCFSLDEESYTGGAHGMYFTTYHNIDLATGTKLTLSDIIKPDMMDALAKTGEQLFRYTKNIPEDKRLSSTGFFTFAQHDSLIGKFYLNDNFSMGNNGLIFHYNVYEIAPYVNGSSKIVIPYSRLKEMALPGSLLEERIARQ
jgi:hypothetical protein